jgi:hypothetical protein
MGVQYFAHFGEPARDPRLRFRAKPANLRQETQYAPLNGQGRKIVPITKFPVDVPRDVQRGGKAADVKVHRLMERAPDFGLFMPPLSTKLKVQAPEPFCSDVL